MTKKILFSSGMLLVILVASIYVMLPDTVKFVVEDTRSRIYVSEEGDWVLGATEYVYLYDGVKKMRAKHRVVRHKVYDGVVKAVRTSYWKDNIVTTHIYLFNTSSSDVKLVPMSSTFICENCQGKIVHFEYRDIKYDGITRPAVSPEEFGHNMVVEWDDGYDWAKMYQQKVASDKLIIRYRPNNTVNMYKVRMYDPPGFTVNPGIYSTTPAVGDTVICNYTKDWVGEDNSSYQWYVNDITNETGSVGVIGSSGDTSEYYDPTGSGQSIPCHVTRNCSQGIHIGTAGASDDFVLDKIEVLISLTNNPDADITVRLQGFDASANGGPNSTIFATGTILESAVNGNAVRINATMTAYTLRSGENYTIVVDSTTDGGNGYYNWHHDTNVDSGNYDGTTRGLRWYVASWSCPDAGADCLDDGGFKVWVKNFTTQETNLTTTAYLPGDDLVCEVTPYNGVETGTAINSSGVELSGDPVASSVSVSPDPAYVFNNLTCTYTFVNSSGGSGGDESNITWDKNGLSIFNYSTTLNSGNFSIGDNISCTVEPCDGSSCGVNVTSSNVTIDTFSPVASAVAITPASPIDSDELACSYTFANSTNSTGNDNSTIVWYVNDIEVQSKEESQADCYQEHANVSTSCGGLSTGQYSLSAGWDASRINNVYDGDWVTFGRPTTDTPPNMTITYQKPTDATSAKILTSAGSSGSHPPTNSTIPSSCWDHSSTNLTIVLYAWGVSNNHSWSCENASGLHLLSSAAGYRIYEEAMWWNVAVSTDLNSSASSQGDSVVCEVEPCDYSVCGNKVNSSSETINPIPDVNLEVPKNLTVELGSIVYLRANSSDATICVDVDHPDFGVNYSCGSPPLDLALNITYFTETTLNTSSELNLTYASVSNLSVATDNLHEYSELINFSMLLTGFSNGGSYPQNVSVYVNDTLSNTVGDLITTTTTVSTLNDSSTAVNFSFTKEEVMIVYVELPKLVTISEANLTVTGFESGGACIQESADEATTCGGTAGGNYWSNTNYVYANYEFPDGVNKTATNWTVNHGDSGNYTVSLDSSCADITGTLARFRMYSRYDYSDGGLDPAESYGQCSNGTDWITITNVEDAGVNTITYDAGEDYSYLAHDGDYTTYSLWIEEASDGSVDEWSKDVSILNDALWYDEAVVWYYDSTYPNNTYLEVGSIDGTREWNHTGTFTGPNTTSDFSTELNTYLNSCSSDDAGNCQVPLYFGSSRRGTLQISSISIQYDSGNTTESITINIDRMDEYLADSTGFTNVPIRIESSKGIIQISNINLSYAGGNKTFEIKAHNTTYSQNWTSTFTYHYSDWTYNLPTGIPSLEWIPKTPTSKNVAPFGQSNTRPILNFTGQNYGSMTFNLSMYLNESEPASCANLTFGTTNTSSSATQIIEATWTDIVTNHSIDTDQNVWMWTNYSCSYAYWSLWQPTLDVVACCESCDICDLT